MRGETKTQAPDLRQIFSKSFLLDERQLIYRICQSKVNGRRQLETEKIKTAGEEAGPKHFSLIRAHSGHRKLRIVLDNLK